MEDILSLVRFLAGGYFIWSGSTKLRSASTFWAQIMGYKITTPRQARFLAAILPQTEFLAGLFFAAGVFPFVGASLLLIMLAMFTTALIISLVKKMGNDCGCGPGANKVSPRLVVRNLILASLVVAGAFAPISDYPGKILIGIVALVIVAYSGVARYRSLGN